MSDFAPRTLRVAASMAAFVLLGVLFTAVGATGCGGDEPAAKSAEAPSLPEAKAVELAVAAAEAEGYDRETYTVMDANRQKDGSWSVFLQHKPPAPPGGHCLVEVDAKGHTTVHHGR